MDTNPGNGDLTQRRRLARLLRDPTGYFAAARREAREHAHRSVTEQLDRRSAGHDG